MLKRIRRLIKIKRLESHLSQGLPDRRNLQRNAARQMATAVLQQCALCAKTFNQSRNSSLCPLCTTPFAVQSTLPPYQNEAEPWNQQTPNQQLSPRKFFSTPSSIEKQRHGTLISCNCKAPDCLDCARRDAKLAAAKSIGHFPDTGSSRRELSELVSITEKRLNDLEKFSEDKLSMAEQLRAEGETQIGRIKQRFGQLFNELLTIQNCLISQIKTASNTADQRVADADDLLKNGRELVTKATDALKSGDLGSTISCRRSLNSELRKIDKFIHSNASSRVILNSSYESDLQSLISTAESISTKIADSSYSVISEMEDGVIFALGGWDGWNRCNLAEVFDPVRNRWLRVADMLARRDFPASTHIDGKVYVTGGLDGDQTLSSCEVYDPLSNQWQEIPPMHISRHGHALVHLDGELYAIGGSDGSNRLSSVERYNLRNRKWRFIASMQYARGGLSCTVLQKQLIAVGGWDGKENLAAVEACRVETGRWKSLRPMNVKRLRAAIATHNDERIFVFGGWNESNSRLDSIEEYSATSEKWCIIEATLQTGRSCFGAACLNNKIYLVGGWSQKGLLDSVECFDPTERNFLGEVAPISTAREYVAVTYCDCPIDSILQNILPSASDTPSVHFS